MLAIFGSIQSRPAYAGGQLMGIAFQYGKVTVHNCLGKFTVLNAETGGPVGQEVLTPDNE